MVSNVHVDPVKMSASASGGSEASMCSMPMYCRCLTVLTPFFTTRDVAVASSGGFCQESLAPVARFSLYNLVFNVHYTFVTCVYNTRDRAT